MEKCTSLGLKVYKLLLNLFINLSHKKIMKIRRFSYFYSSLCIEHFKCLYLIFLKLIYNKTKCPWKILRQEYYYNILVFAHNKNEKVHDIVYLINWIQIWLCNLFLSCLNFDAGRTFNTNVIVSQCLEPS